MNSLKIFFIRPSNSLFEPYLRLPAQPGDLRYIEQLARGSVGFGSIPGDASLVAADVGDKVGEIFDGGVFAAAEVDDRSESVCDHRIILMIVEVHQKNAGACQVVYVQEFSAGNAGTPKIDGIGHRDLRES